MNCPKHAVIVSLLSLVGAAGALQAQAPPSFKEAARSVQAATVTVRIVLPVEQSGRSKASVTVCTGVAVGKHLIVSSAFAASDASIRITTSTGGRARARLRVLDEYSGLVLLEAAELELTPAPLAEQAPEVGSWALGSAAWGAEPPVLSFGLVSGVDRQLAGYPPLLQCDLRTAETSSGSALVNIQGELLGVVVAADDEENRRGWTYAVPVRHVRRLLRTWEAKRQGNETEQDAAPGGDQQDATNDRDDSVVVLRRRRPVVGMVLADDGEQQILVRRVAPNSPAQRAGIEVGDQVLAADGVQIRSVYEAVRPVMNRQPGDTISYLIQKPTGSKEISVVLGGGVELPAAPLAEIGQLVRPKIDIEGLPDGFQSRSGDQVRQFVASDNADDLELQGEPTVEEKIQLLERALDSYRNVIKYQQQQLQRAEAARQRDQQMLEELRRELEQRK